MKIAVTGPTGKLGRNVVQKLSKLQIPTKILLRHDVTNVQNVPITLDGGENEYSKDQVAAFLSKLPNVETVKGDITDGVSLISLVGDCDAVLCVHGARRSSRLSDILPWTHPEDDDKTHSKQVNYKGIKLMIDACRKSDSCKRIIRITGKGETPWNFFSILINMLGSMAKAWNYEGEQLLRACKDIDYTIIRPGVMGRPDVPTGKVLALADNGGDLKVSPVSHEMIAELCINCLNYPNAARSTLCAMNVPDGEGEETYAPLLEKVKPDSREFDPTIFQQHQKAVSTVFVAMSATVLAAIVKGITIIIGLLG